MRQVHVAGDKLFVDYSGKKPHIVDATTGEVIEVELFVAALGASNLTYAEATCDAARARLRSRATCARSSTSAACRRRSCPTS